MYSNSALIFPTLSDCAACTRVSLSLQIDCSSTAMQICVKPFDKLSKSVVKFYQSIFIHHELTGLICSTYQASSFIWSYIETQHIGYIIIMVTYFRASVLILFLLRICPNRSQGIYYTLIDVQMLILWTKQMVT